MAAKNEISKLAVKGFKAIIQKNTKLLLLMVVIPVVFVLTAGSMFWGTVKETFNTAKEQFAKVLDNIEIVDNNLKINQGYMDEINKRLKNMGIDSNTLGLEGNSEYLMRFLESEIVTNFPYLGGNGLQGTVYFERASLDGKVKELKYKKFDEFYRLQNEGNQEVYNYFTIDTADWTVNVIKSVSNGNFEIEKINYKNMVSKYSMPFEFTIAIATVIQNPQFALAIVDLVKDSKITITIAESKTVTTTTRTKNYTDSSTMELETGGVEDFGSSEVSYVMDENVSETNTTNVFLSRAKTWVLNQTTDYTHEDRSETRDPIIENLSDEYGKELATEGTIRYKRTNVNITTETKMHHQRWNVGKTTITDKVSNFTDLIKRDGNTGAGISQIAKESHDYLANNKYWYPSQANIDAGDFVEDGESVTHKFPAIGEPTNQRYVDCSAYVSWVLKEAGYEIEMSGSGKSGLVQYAKDKGWEEITEVSDLQAGDICFYEGSSGPTDPNHVNICVGEKEGKKIFYDCGNSNAIRTVDPIMYDMGSFLFAYRPNDEVVKKLAPTSIADYREKLENYVSNISEGKYSISITNLDKTSEKININDIQIESEGLLKLYIMTTAYQEIKDGKVKEEDISASIERMIISNSNDAANMVLEQIGQGKIEEGIKKVNGYIKAKGYRNTNIETQLATIANMNVDANNYTSASDVAKLLEEIYKNNGDWWNPTDKMMNLLKGQLIVDMIPSKITNATIRNKTGEQENILEDAAIVSNSNANYILVIRATDIQNKEKAKNEIAEIANQLNNYFQTNGKIKDNYKNDKINKDIDYKVLNGKVCYKVAKVGYVCPLDNLIEGKDMLFDLLRSSEKTQNHENFIKYVLYLLTGKNYGVTEFDVSTFLGGTMNQNGGSGLKLLRDYIRMFERSGYCETFENGTMYKIDTDGYNNPTVGFGVDIFNGGYEAEFKANGYPTEVGGLVPVEFVDALEERKINTDLSNMREDLRDLNLKEYQLHALVSRSYNQGYAGALSNMYSEEGKNFSETYNAYWNKEKDEEYKVPKNDGMFNHKLYTTFMCNTVYSAGEVAPGLVTRRKSEWILFKTGYYDMIDKYWIEGLGTGSDANASELQLRIADVAQNSGAYGINATGGRCLEWVFSVYDAAGIASGSAGCAFCGAQKYGVSTDISTMPIGAAIYGEGYDWQTPGTDGYNYGHVGIYIGNGKIAHNIGGVAITTVEDWIATCPFGCWGWASDQPVDPNFPANQGLFHDHRGSCGANWRD